VQRRRGCDDNGVHPWPYAHVVRGAALVTARRHGEDFDDTFEGGRCMPAPSLCRGVGGCERHTGRRAALPHLGRVECCAVEPVVPKPCQAAFIRPRFGAWAVGGVARRCIDRRRRRPRSAAGSMASAYRILAEGAWTSGCTPAGGQSACRLSDAARLFRSAHGVRRYARAVHGSRIRRTALDACSATSHALGARRRLQALPVWDMTI